MHRAIPRLVLAVVLGAGACWPAVFFAGCATSSPPAPARMETVAQGAKGNFIDPEVIRKVAADLPRPPTTDSVFEKEVVVLVEKDAVRAWPRLGTWAKATDPKDAYSGSGFDYLVLLDPALAVTVDRASTAADKAKVCRAKYPKTCELLERATDDLTAAKYKIYSRTRPDGSGTDSYPSGHASRASFQCRLLAIVLEGTLPAAAASEKEDVLLREAWSRGLYRVALGVHHPSDVTAGFVFGQLALEQIVKADSPAFRASLADARREWGSAAR